MSSHPTSIATAPRAAGAAAQADPILRSVSSRDGTTIGYREFGRGPGLVLLHGSMSSGVHHVELARLLSDAFTVFVPDRRGRGLSGPYRNGDELKQELEDVAAILEATGATNLWGLSSGACIALHAGRTMPMIKSLGIFEPPLLPDRAAASVFLAKFDDQMARGRIGEAMITAMRRAEMGPAWFRALPKGLTARLAMMGMAQEAKKPAGPYPKMRELALTLHVDFAIVAESSGRLDDYRAIRADVLLMGGSKSPGFLKRALADLARVLPSAKRIELEGLDHAASWNSDVRGNPEPVARELRRFFA
jgi:pimeloyl-ACP methyl ester carboxylesterase